MGASQHQSQKGRQGESRKKKHLKTERQRLEELETLFLQQQQQVKQNDLSHERQTHPIKIEGRKEKSHPLQVRLQKMNEFDFLSAYHNYSNLILRQL